MKTKLPLRYAIIEILENKNGQMLDSDLLTALKARYDFKEISLNEINKNLLSLETQGLIHVQVISKYKRMIIKVEGNMYMGVEED